MANMKTVAEMSTEEYNNLLRAARTLRDNNPGMGLKESLELARKENRTMKFLLTDRNDKDRSHPIIAQFDTREAAASYAAEIGYGEIEEWENPNDAYDVLDYDLSVDEVRELQWRGSIP